MVNRGQQTRVITPKRIRGRAGTCGFARYAPVTSRFALIVGLARTPIPLVSSHRQDANYSRAGASVGDLDRLEAEINDGLLEAWIKVYVKAQAIYDGLPEDEKRRIEEHGHEVESLVWVIVQMKPHVRALCWALVEQGRAASLSQTAVMVDDAVEHVIAQAKSSSGAGGVDEERLSVLEERAERIESMLDELITRLVGERSALPDDRSEPRAD